MRQRVDVLWQHLDSMGEGIGVIPVHAGASSTRFWAISLIIVTIVAIFGVHWPDEWNSLADLWKGYVITDKGFGNYRVPLLFLAMLFPLALRGPGRVCVDHLLSTKVFK